MKTIRQFIFYPAVLLAYTLGQLIAPAILRGADKLMDLCEWLEGNDDFLN